MELIDLMHDEIIRPERQYGSCSQVVGEIVKVRDLEQDPKTNKSLEPLLDGPATSQHMSASLPLKLPDSGKCDAILDSFLTTTPSMHV